MCTLDEAHKCRARNKAPGYQSKKEKKEKKFLIAATEASEVKQGIVVSSWTITIPQQPTPLVIQFKY